MLYNLLGSKNYVHTAGKITIATAVLGMIVVASVFLLNAGKTELMKVEAQGAASTTLTVLNTPPQWVASSSELVESSITSPTNSGNVVSWVAVANDPNQANYYLLICGSSAAPSSTNSGAPRCNGGVQWGVSAPTPVNTQAVVSTTTTEIAPFFDENDWYAWVCDNDSVNARCNATFTNGTNATNSSPFYVNFRPVFGTFGNDSPADPGETVAFTSSSSDPYGDEMYLTVCSTAAYSTTTNTCDAETLATTTVGVTSNPGANYVVPLVMPDDNYNAFGYLRDEFGHEASGGAQGTNSIFQVNNVAPTVTTISLNGGLPLDIAIPGAETTGFTLSFTTVDANSCRTSPADSFEIVDYVASVFRSGVGTSSCSGTDSAQYDPNDCYPSSLATTTWNLNCTASTTTCTAGGEDPTMDWTCTFPLWFLADATDAGSFYEGQDWRAAVAGIDDDAATGTLELLASGVDVESLTALDLLTSAIPYGQLEPGDDSGTLSASTTVQSLGNTGLNQQLSGESMCGTFSVGNECPNSASSTIPESEQEFATSSVAYGSGTSLSSTTPFTLQLQVPKSTSTSTPSSGVTYWGIAVPIDITLAGSYTGLNTFTAAISASTTWGY
jgi:hypothetical protein